MLGFCVFWCPAIFGFFALVLLLTALAESGETKAGKLCDALLMRCLVYLDTTTERRI